MHATLGRALLIGVPVSMLLVFSVVRFARARNASAVLQLLGAGCLLLVVLTHVAEGLHLFGEMRFGEPDSVGHYLDLSSAVIGVILLGGAAATQGLSYLYRSGRWS